MRKSLMILLLTLTAHGQPFEDVTEQVGMSVPSLTGMGGL
jgi:hypothetical protein